MKCRKRGRNDFRYERDVQATVEDIVVIVDGSILDVGVERLDPCRSSELYSICHVGLKSTLYSTSKFSHVAHVSSVLSVLSM